MAFRLEALIAFCSLTLAAAPLEFAVRHQHAYKGGPGKVVFEDSGILFTESGKKKKHSRQWKYEDIQQLVVAPEWLRIVTYEDVRWQMGRDREYFFDRVPAGFAAAVYPMLSQVLDRRFVAVLADPAVEPLWEMPVKLRNRLGGSEGTLITGRDHVVYKSSERDQSRTWRIADIEAVSTAEPFELSIMTREREFRFQLKRALSERQYTELWRQVQASKLKP
jgi:hypothetical protein